MINSLLNGLIEFFKGFLNLILGPIDNLIVQYLPDFSDMLDYVGNFFNIILGFIPWILSWLHIPAIVLGFVLSYWIAKLTLSFLIHEIKLVVAWWDRIVA